MRRRFGRTLGAAVSVGAAVLAAPLILRAVWSWPHRIAVQGHSMEPTLADGDWLLVDPDAYLQRHPVLGDLVVARDARSPGRLIVKRVVATDRQGHVLVAGDHPDHRSEAVQIGRLGAADLLGRPWLRYWPPGRIGTV